MWRGDSKARADSRSHVDLLAEEEPGQCVGRAEGAPDSGPRGAWVQVRAPTSSLGDLGRATSFPRASVSSSARWGRALLLWSNRSVAPGRYSPALWWGS